MRDGFSLPEFWQLAVRHHNALRAFALAHTGDWNPAVRRSVWQGLAVLASMIRRLIHIMARDIRLAPLSPRDPEGALPPLPGAPARRGIGFRLVETTRASRPGGAAQDPETPEMNIARFFDRLSVLAAAYRARHRLARRLARRVQMNAAPLRTLPLPPRLHARAIPLFTGMLAKLGREVGNADTS